jgi:hypothetical protein
MIAMPPFNQQYPHKRTPFKLNRWHKCTASQCRLSILRAEVCLADSAAAHAIASRASILRQQPLQSGVAI